MSEPEYDPENLEVGDSFPCPGCSGTSLPDELLDLPRQHWEGEIKAVNDIGVQCKYCESWYHRKLLIPQDEFSNRKSLAQLLSSDGETPPVGEWVSDETMTQTFRSENPALLNGAGLCSPEVQRDVEIPGPIAVGATTYANKDKLLAVIRAMDGDRIRLDVQDDGLVFLSTVNWKRQRMQAAVAPLRSDAHQMERLDERLGDWLDIFDHGRGDAQ